MLWQKLIFSLEQALKRVARSSKFASVAAVRAADATYTVRKRIGLIPRAVSGITIGEDAEDLRPFHRYQREFSYVEGFFGAGAIATWDTLLSLQTANGSTGNLLEIGVFKGKSAALLALHARPDETCVFVDPTLRKMATDAVESIRTHNNLWVEDMSQNLRSHERLRSLAGTFRWIHIDGEHTGRAVRNDLEIAESLLSREGIVSLDDFMSPAYPQITAAAFEVLQRRRNHLTLFLSGFNKGYICRTDCAPTYLQFLKDRVFRELQRRGFTNVTVWKSTDPADMNCFGVTTRFQQFEHKGPDWAPDTIPI